MLPSGYRGPFIAIYGQHDGAQPQWIADTAKFLVPKNGILKIVFDEPPHSTTVSHVFADSPDKWLGNVPTCADMRAYVTDTIPRVCWMDYWFGGTGIAAHIVAVVTDWDGIPKNFERTSFVYDSLLRNGDGKTIRKWEEPPELRRRSRSEPTAVPAGIHDPIPAEPSSSPCTEKFSGPGARPVSQTTVANWYIKNGQLIYVVFLRGDPGWYNRHTDWHNSMDPTEKFTQDLDVDGFRYSLVLDKDSRLLSVLGRTVDVAKTNVVLLDRSGDSAVVSGLEQHYFCWASPPDVVDEVLTRSTLTTQFVSVAPSGSR